MKNIRLENLEKFGNREILEASELMKAYVEGKCPENFYNDGVTVEFNPNSGNVFLTNSEYQVAMFEGEELKIWYWLDYHGNEGFIEDLYEQFKDGYVKQEDFEELADALQAEGMEEEAEEVRDKIEE